MNLDKLNDWLSLLSHFGVVAGLIFLGYEIRQNTIQLRTEASYSMNEALSMVNAGVYNDPVFAEIKVRGEADFSALNQTERAQFSAFQFDRINLAIHYLALKEQGLSDCEITDPAGRPVIMTTGDNPEDRGDRGSTRDQAKEESH